MPLGLVIGMISASATLIAGIALALTYRQFKRIDQSIKGNTYQLLSDQAIAFLKLLLEYPHLKYLDLGESGGSKAKRQQAIFDRMLANYLENVWAQMQLGLLHEELAASYERLIDAVTNNPAIARQMMAPNFSEGLRRYIADRSTVSNGPK